jgi:hypothetical protein
LSAGGKHGDTRRSAERNPSDLLGAQRRTVAFDADSGRDSKKYGYIPLEVQELVSKEIGVPVAEIYGVVTFYNFFSLNPERQIRHRRLPRHRLLRQEFASGSR